MKNAAVASLTNGVLQVGTVLDAGIRGIHEIFVAHHVYGVDTDHFGEHDEVIERSATFAVGKKHSVRAHADRMRPVEQT